MAALLPTLSSRISSMVLIVTIIALCFSVGEGLHLTPFAVSDNVSNVQSSGPTLSSSGASINVYGPLDVPVQQQKRNSRASVELLCLATPYSLAPTTHRALASSESSCVVVNNLLFTLPTDRGPPVTS